MHQSLRIEQSILFFVVLTLTLATSAYAQSGTLDASFGAEGSTTIDFHEGTDEARDVVVQSDGKIVVAGRATGTEGTDDFGVVRLNADGTVDASFGNDGRVTINIGTSENAFGIDVAHAVTLLADGRILLAGSTDNPGGTQDIALVRLHADGRVDSTFGADGIQLWVNGTRIPMGAVRSVSEGTTGSETTTE